MIALGLRNKRNQEQKLRKEQLSKTAPAPKRVERKFLPKKDKKKKKGSKDDKKKPDGEINYHSLHIRPTWADDTGELYGVYRHLREEEEKKKRDRKKREKNGDTTEGEEADEVADTRKKAMSAHKRWMRKKNKVSDGKAAGGSGSNTKKVKAKTPRRESSGAAIVLWVGFGLVVVGVILSVVGGGEDGFAQAELQLIGPSLVGMGIFFCLLRIFACTCGPKCLKVCPCLDRWGFPKKEPPTVGDTPSRANPEAGDAAGQPTAATNEDADDTVRPATAPLVSQSTRRLGPPINRQGLMETNGNLPGVGGSSTSLIVQRPVRITRADTVRFVNEVESNTQHETKKKGAEQVNGGFSDEEDYLAEFEEVELGSPIKVAKPKRKVNELVLDPATLAS